MRVLIADDSEIICEKLKDLLNDVEGIEIVDVASDGLESVEKFWKHRPDIVLLDLNMPKLDGIQVLQNIKTNEFPMVVIVITNYCNEYYREVCFQYGADYFLDKSKEFFKVYEICEQLILEKKQQDSVN